MKKNFQFTALIMLLLTEDVNHADGDDNTPGLYQKSFLIPRSYVKTMPDPVQPDIQFAADYPPEDLVTITADIILKPAKKAIEMYSTLEESELKSMMQGSLDGKSFAPEVTLFQPGNKKKIHGLVAWLRNNHFYLIIQDGDENKLLVGHKIAPLVFDKWEFATGKKGDDRKGANFTFKCPIAKRPVLFFEGDIVEDIDGNEILEFIP